ncbi:hypothetical protein [Escherichia coli]|uniref:hypothetical protein n=1 Tax=Escherichia coli TaxID=562 RepID=UPI0037DDC618
MSKFVVDEFVIELNLQDKVIPAVRKIESEVEKIAAGIESRFRRLRLNIPVGGSGGVPGGVPASRPPRQPRVRNFDDRAYAAANSAAINRMFMGSRAQAIAGLEQRSRVWAAAGRANATGETSAFRRSVIEINNTVRRLNTGFSRLASEENRAARAAERLGNSAGHAHDGFSKLITGFFALHTAVHLLREAINEGVERQRAENAMRVAYSAPGEADAQMKEVKKLSDMYGTNLSEALQQSANLKTLLGNFLSDAQIAQYHESIVVGGGATGANADQMQRFTVALEKMSGMKTGGGAVFTQLQRNMAPLMGMIAKQEGKTLSEFREWAKTQTGSKVASSIVKDMAGVLNQKTEDRHGNTVTVRDLYQQSLQVALNRVTQDWIDSMTKFTAGAEEGTAAFARSLSDLMRNNSWLFERLGEVFGNFLNEMVPVVNSLNDLFVTLGKWNIDLTFWFHSLGKPLQDFISGIGNAVTAIVGGRMLVSAIGIATSALLKFAGVAAVSGGGGNSRGGGGAPGALGNFGKVLGKMNEAYWLYFLASNADNINKWMSDNANDLRESMGLSRVKQRTHEEIMNDPNTSTFGKVMAFDPFKDIDWRGLYHKAVDGSPLANGNWTGSTSLSDAAKQNGVANNNALYQKQSLDIKAPDWKPINQTLTLDLSLAQQQIKSTVQAEVQDQQMTFSYGSSALAYNPTQSAMFNQ